MTDSTPREHPLGGCILQEFVIHIGMFGSKLLGKQNHKKKLYIITHGKVFVGPGYYLPLMIPMEMDIEYLWILFNRWWFPQWFFFFFSIMVFPIFAPPSLCIGSHAGSIYFGTEQYRIIGGFFKISTMM